MHTNCCHLTCLVLHDKSKQRDRKEIKSVCKIKQIFQAFICIAIMILKKKFKRISKRTKFFCFFECMYFRNTSAYVLLSESWITLSKLFGYVFQRHVNKTKAILGWSHRGKEFSCLKETNS